MADIGRHGRHRAIVVIGAGQSGLATAHWLARAGADFVLLDAGHDPVGSWPAFYDSLTLFSPARYSGLPGLAFPGPPDRYPRRDEVVAYLRDYAARLAPPIRHGEQVVRVDAVEGGFVIETARGTQWTADRVISATGIFGRPRLPDFAGQARFGGTILHSAQYRRPADLPDGPVAVVGGGNSALQIALELARDRDVVLFTRSGLRFLPQRLLGRDIHFWLRSVGYDTSPLGAWFGIAPAEPILDPGLYKPAIEAGTIRALPMFDALTEDGARMADGSRLAFSVLVAATGFHAVPAYLDGLLAAGHPLLRGGAVAGLPGLNLVGMPWQVSHASATLRGVGADARRIVRRTLRGLGAPRALQVPA